MRPFIVCALVALGSQLAVAGSARAESTHAPDSSQAASVAAGRQAPLELSAGPQLVHRSFSYSDEVASLYPAQKYPKLAPLRLGAGPSAFAALELYPVGASQSAIASHLGLLARYERAFATSVLFAENTSYERKLDTKSYGWLLGVKARLPLAEHVVSLSAAYGVSSFELLGDEAAPAVPDVAYRFVQADLGTRFNLGAPFLRLHGGARFLLDTGAIGSRWFPGAKAKCLEIGGGGGYALSRSFELELGVEYVRYGFDFNPVPATANPWTQPVAGGALDQYLNVSLTARYLWGGKKS